MNKQDKIVITIIAIFIFIQLLVITFFKRLMWDEAVYIGLGKYIYSNGTIGLWEFIRPLAYPVILGFLWKLNINIIIAGKIITVLFASGSIWLTYKITKKLINKNIAVIAAVLLATFPIFFGYSTMILTEIPSVFFSLLAANYFINNKIEKASIASAIAFLFRFPIGLTFVSILLVLAYRKQIKNISIAIKSFIVTTLPFWIFNTILYAKLNIPFYLKPFYPLLTAVGHQNNPVNSINAITIAQTILHYPLKMLMYQPVLILAPLGLFMLLKTKKKDFQIIITLALTTLAYFTYIINKQDRFMISFIPYIIIITAYGVYQALNYIKKKDLNLKLILGTLIITFLIVGVSEAISNKEKLNLIHTSDFQEFKEFYNSVDIPDDKILSTTPFPAAIDDKLITPYYETPEDALFGYQAYKDSIDYIVYTEDFYPCDNEECEQQKEQLIKKIESENTILKKQELKAGTYYIFKR